MRIKHGLGVIALVGASTVAVGPPAGAADPGNVAASLISEQVWGWGWAPSDDITLTITDGPGGPVEWTATISTSPTGDYTVDTGIDVRGGLVYTAEQDGVAQTLDIVELTIDALEDIDYAENVVHGTAPDDLLLELQAGDPAGTSMLVATDGSGNWSGDFDDVGLDLTEEMTPHLLAYDAEGDHTVTNSVSAGGGEEYSGWLAAGLTNESIWGSEWDPSQSVQIVVHDGVGGPVLWTGHVNPEADSSFWITPGVDVIPGLEIVATQGDTERILVTFPLEITAVDHVENTVSGTTTPFRAVSAHVYVEGGAFSPDVETVADANGDWVVDFDSVGYDVMDGQPQAAHAYEEDGDATHTDGIFVDPPVVECAGVEATIVGTDGTDVLFGTAGDDVIHAGAGADVILGGGGNDLICGGAGGDFIFGQEGDDEIFGQRGRDRIFGGSGFDQVDGGAGVDMCRAESHVDCERVVRFF